MTSSKPQFPTSIQPGDKFKLVSTSKGRARITASLARPHHPKPCSRGHQLAPDTRSLGRASSLLVQAVLTTRCPFSNSRPLASSYLLPILLPTQRIPTPIPKTELSAKRRLGTQGPGLQCDLRMARPFSGPRFPQIKTARRISRAGGCRLRCVRALWWPHDTLLLSLA